MLEVACHCTRVRRAARVLTELYDAALEPCGIKVTQFSLLRMILRLGEPSIGALAAATGLDRSTLGRNLRVLARKGWVTLLPGTDERCRLVRPTPRGRAALATAEPAWEALQRRIDRALGADAEAAAALLARLTALPEALRG